VRSAPRDGPGVELTALSGVPLLGVARSEFANIEVPLWGWGAFIALLAALLSIDLVVHRGNHAPTAKRALVESAAWVACGLAFSVVVLLAWGGQAFGEYMSGYVIEKSLSIDNVFVWAIIFTTFAIPLRYQHRVLFWGIFGALVLRAIFIFAGVALIEAFDWILYVFGAFLLITAVRVARHKDAEVHPENNPVLRLVRKVVPSTNDYDGQKLFTKRTGRLLATPLFAVLILVETTDVVFAVDSIPAILAVSREPFIVFSSNAFAILGLRSLYFLLAGMAGRFRYLNIGLGAILFFVGIKMIIVEWYHFPTYISLLVIAGLLTVTIWLSLRAEKRDLAAESTSSGHGD
jgi:tellurite resistance protein TerC